MNLTANRLAIFSLITASIIWGATGPIMKLTLKEVPLFSLAFIRFFTATLILLPFIYKKISVDKKDFFILIISAILGITLNISFFFLGLTLTTALNTGIIVASGPIFALIAGHFVLKEKVSKNLIIGAIVGILGISVIIGKDILSNGFHLSPLGDFFILITMLCFVFYQIISKELFKKYNPFVLTFYSFAIGALSFLPAMLFELQKEPLWFSSLSTNAIFGILFGIFFSSLAAFSLWQWGLSKIAVSKADFFFYLDPVVSTILAMVLLSEKITFPFVIGSILILLGIFFAEKRFPYHHK